MNTVLITGANRGIGLECAKQYLDSGFEVLACCRDPEKSLELQRLKQLSNKIHIFQLDVTKSDTVKKLQHSLQNRSIDILINNAGIYGATKENFGNINEQNLLDVFRTNVWGVINMCQNFYQMVKKSELKKIITISSLMGSIADNQSGRAYAYRASKAALNAVMKSMSIDCITDGVRILILHPGWVKTDMGGNNALVTVQESVAGMRAIIDNEMKWHSGDFYNYRGEKLPW